MPAFRSLPTRWRHAPALAASAALIALAAPLAQAATVSYEATSLGADRWRYVYTLGGDAPTGGFDGLTIYFDAAAYSQLSNFSIDAAWDPLVIQRDLGIPADGYVDALHLGGALTGALSPLSFSVEVSYAGAGAPGSQRFELYLTDPQFSIVQDGFTQAAVSAVPEPASVAMAALGLGMLAVTRRRTRPAA